MATAAKAMLMGALVLEYRTSCQPQLGQRGIAAAAGSDCFIAGPDWLMALPLNQYDRRIMPSSSPQSLLLRASGQSAPAMILGALPPLSSAPFENDSGSQRSAGRRGRSRPRASGGNLRASKASLRADCSESRSPPAQTA